METDVAVVGVPERAGDGTDDREPEALPEPDRSRVGLDDRVELDAAEPGLPAPLDHVPAEEAPHAAALRLRSDHEAAGRDV